MRHRGEWSWPPAAPTLPANLNIGNPVPVLPTTGVPNSLVQPPTALDQTSCQTELNIPQCIQIAIQHTGAQLLDTAAQQVVHQAATGLVELSQQQGTLSMDGL